MQASEPNLIKKNEPKFLLILFSLVALSCLIGVLSRPAGLLASIWPANALMLGLLLRLPSVATPLGWLVGASAFITVDFITGSSLQKNILLNLTNLCSIAIAYFYLRRLDSQYILLKHPNAIIHIMISSIISGFGASILGAHLNPILFNASKIDGLTFWWVSEIVNYVAVLPIILAFPKWRNFKKLFKKRSESGSVAVRKHDFLPAITVGLCCLGSALIGGPGAIAFPVLALLWGAMVYPVYLTAFLTLCCSLLTLLVFPSVSPTDLNTSGLFSIRLGVSVIAIAPILLSIVIQRNNQLLYELRHLSMHDPLTGIYNRAAFFKYAAKLLAQKHQSHAIMMLDLDHFKRVNDTYGHAAGDKVLINTAKTIKNCLRIDDKLCRMGGEEFAVFVHNCSLNKAAEIAERIRLEIESNPIELEDKQVLHITISIGLSEIAVNNTLTIEQILAKADAALYHSKKQGRNRVELASKVV